MASTPTTSPQTAERERYDFAYKVRELELDLFWKRSLFFWGFIGAAFVAFAAVRDSEYLAVLVASFGFVCSFVWTFANRGSKFWYENWEQKLERAEVPFTGPWFGSPEPPRPNNWWLRARQYSVSKLAIALSDYVAALWLALLAGKSFALLQPATAHEWRPNAAVAFALFSVAYAFAAAYFSRSALPERKKSGRRDA